LGPEVQEYGKVYGENYCLGQLIFWHNQSNADPDCSLVRATEQVGGVCLYHTSVPFMPRLRSHRRIVFTIQGLSDLCWQEWLALLILLLLLWFLTYFLSRLRFQENNNKREMLFHRIKFSIKLYGSINNMIETGNKNTNE